jgi:hypothetical protein
LAVGSEEFADDRHSGEQSPRLKVLDSQNRGLGTRLRDRSRRPTRLTIS